MHELNDATSAADRSVSSRCWDTTVPRPRKRQIVINLNGNGVLQARSSLGWQLCTTSGENTVKKGRRSCQHGGRHNPAPAVTGVLRHPELL
jgi:hypothetical protein